jgi:hypothetical protein
MIFHIIIVPDRQLVVKLLLKIVMDPDVAHLDGWGIHNRLQDA